MGKKQTAATQAAKAAKKAKAVQKVERKETKKAFKSKGGPNTNEKGKVNVKKKKKADDSDTDGEDLEGILEKVGRPECTFVCKNLLIVHLHMLDAKGLGSCTFCHRRTC